MFLIPSMALLAAAAAPQNVREPVATWDDLTIMYGQEIDVVFRDGVVEYPAGRQESLHIVR